MQRRLMIASVSSVVPVLLLSHFLAFAVFRPRCLADTVSNTVQQAEQQRIAMIERASRSVVSILTPDQANGGSGVIITPDGYGVTNFHVIMGLGEARRGLGGLAGGKTYPLEVLGIAPTGDLAMFRLTGRDSFDAAPLGDSNSVRLGDPVVALGNPFMLAEDFTPTATFGIVSGLNRYQRGADTRALVYTDCLQIDASINPGNSGGPLFDMQGRVIGINGRASFQRQDVLRQRVNVGVAYAISINQVKRFIPALMEGKLVEHGTLGATVTDSPDGPRFDAVLQDSAADRIGITIGDRLIAFDGRPMTSANAFANILGVYPAGWPVWVTYARGDRQFHREVSLDTLPLPGEVPWPKADPAWIHSLAKGRVPTTLPYDITALAAPSSGRTPTTALSTDSDDTDRPDASAVIASILPGVVKIHGGRIAGQEGYAGGVLVSAEGEVITALAVLLDASDLRVVTADGTVHRADVIHRDAHRRLALLKIKGAGGFSGQSSDAVQADATRANGLTPAAPLEIDESIEPAPGDDVFVVGNPFKIAGDDEPCSVSRGILSGRIPLQARLPNGGRDSPFTGEVWVFDAIASNPGSPGSAVFDVHGRWIGLVGEVLESRSTNTMLNYAYPVSEVAAFLQEARGTPAGPDETAEPAAKPGYHGIRLSRFGYRQRLPFVDSVPSESPAGRAGVRRGDLIVSVNAQPISNATAFEEACTPLKAGDELALTLKRGDKLISVRFKLEEPPE